MTGGHRGLSPDYGVLSVEDFASFFILDCLRANARVVSQRDLYGISLVLLSLSRWGSVSRCEDGIWTASFYGFWKFLALDDGFLPTLSTLANGVVCAVSVAVSAVVV